MCGKRKYHKAIYRAAVRIPEPFIFIFLERPLLRKFLDQKELYFFGACLLFFFQFGIRPICLAYPFYFVGSAARKLSRTYNTSDTGTIHSSIWSKITLFSVSVFLPLVLEWCQKFVKRKFLRFSSELKASPIFRTDYSYLWI